MDEETKSKDSRVIKLTPEQYNDLERALQWPEDLEWWDRINKPTRLTELSFISE